MMNCIGVACILLAFYVQYSNAVMNGTLCVTDYWQTFSCALKLPASSSGNTSHWLEFQDNVDHMNGVYPCPIQITNEHHVCSFPDIHFTEYDEYSVKLNSSQNGKNSSYLLYSAFSPAKNIKPRTPFNLTFQHKNGTCGFFWMSGYENHIYRDALHLKYELLYYKDGDPENISVHSDKERIESKMDLDPGCSYTAMVRTGLTTGRRYSGSWSDWSNESSPIGKIVVGTVFILGLIIVFLFIPGSRQVFSHYLPPYVTPPYPVKVCGLFSRFVGHMTISQFKTREIAWVPTPAAYFQPLYENHHGNFKCWVLAKSPLHDNHVLEEFSTLDKISEVTTILQDPVEKPVPYLPVQVHPPAQLHSPYVGPLADAWVPSEIAATCSVSRVPCKLSLFYEDPLHEEDQLMCLRQDEESQVHPALSLKSLGDSDSEREVGGFMNPSPRCFKQDYCILTDTPCGPVPNFSTVGS
ncbi:hypothetical protein DNTS_015829 [Danionella cerebrum]|uniref:Uncharacterized protein n=1 Tax=Danionella cerebrum TaxID=2873325 RepID=A0A553Q8J9_9TELE|nr:hypothetical protein DNTS_015829 [Danionella translucida]